jgi:hypothetical protein
MDSVDLNLSFSYTLNLPAIFRKLFTDKPELKLTESYTECEDPNRAQENNDNPDPSLVYDFTDK